MINKTGRIGWWSLFGVVLLCAITGWLWVVQKLVKNEAESAQLKVKEAEERYLDQVAASFQKRLKQSMETSPDLARIARNGWCESVWFEPAYVDLSFDPEPIQSWRKRILSHEVSAEDLALAIESGELAFGNTVDGRDPVASLTLSMLTRSDSPQPLIEHLRQRVWDYDAPPLSPAFRLMLIRVLIEIAPNEELERLRALESIRAVEGKIEELDEPRRYEVIRHVDEKGEQQYFWTRDQLEKLLNQDEETALVLHEKPIVGKATVFLTGLEHWPYLSIRESDVNASAAGLSGNVFIWVGGLAGLAMLALAVGAAVFASKELRTARMRTDLAASVAHELRTPLAGQRLLLETLMEREDQSEEERAEYVAMAFRENKRLSRLAEEFLTFSRLERGVLQLEIEAVSVSEVISQAVESLHERWDDPECELSVQVDDHLPDASGDQQALITILRNLLENAWKYSDAPKKIGVEAIQSGGEIAITVADQGIGLSPTEQQKIFKQFYRVDRSLARSQDGLGLGLSIVRRLLESMQGSIEVSSRAGEGSEFTIRIPKAS